ncbi:MAG: adenylate/guanylate cyclase domain-containing protein, partial [Solirubrobacteraceae bacterium]
MDRAIASARVFRSGEQALGPYVPSLVADWLRDRPGERHRALDCTLLFADISGFTRMTELLGVQGKIGAEEMAELINATFDSLLRTAYAYGAGLIKWGGDATLLLFQGGDHVVRGCRAAAEMQRVMRQVGGLKTSRGPLRLRMSIGAHSGPCDFFMVGNADHRELIVTGAAATTLAEMEQAAGPGQIVVSDGTAAALAHARQGVPTTAAGSGLLLRRAPDAERMPAGAETADYREVSIAAALCQTMRAHILGGGVESEHRHATIGFLKISGVDTLLAAEGPEATGAALDHAIRVVQDAMTSHEVAFLATDISPNGAKVMLSAGAPRRVGHDEERMIAALREAIDAAGVLALRAGASAGRAFAGDFGPSYRRTYSLMGDCVNLAARLSEHAAEGELLVGDELVAAGNASFAAVAHPPLAVKGKRAPVAAWGIGSATAGRAADEPSSEPLVGREQELGALVESANAVAGGRGRVAEVVGEPGIGKSRLLAELRSRAPGDVIWMDGDVYAGARPYDPFQRWLRAHWEVDADAPADAMASRLRDLARRSATHLTPWLALIGIVAGVEMPAGVQVQQIDPSLRKQRLEELFSELLALILPGPATLIFNDAQLMDDASRDLIARLAADAPARRWLVIVSRRPDDPSPLASPPQLRIELGPLSREAAARLLGLATATAPMPPHRLAELTRRSGGNPLFLRALVAQLRDGGDPTALPRSVEAAIAARIDRLATPDRRVLRSAAVLGMEVELAILTEVLGDEWPGGARGEDPLRALGEFFDPVVPGRRRFSHQLVREVAY